jgi:hypothetical protein
MVHKGWESLFLGAYWKKRQEIRSACASRIFVFLDTIHSANDSFETWFLTGKRRKLALNRIDININNINLLLKTNNRDDTGEGISELGFHIDLWNGQNLSFRVTIGAFSEVIQNAVVLSFRGISLLDKQTWQVLIEAAIKSFDPDSAVITNQYYISRHGNGMPIEAGGLYTYIKGEKVEEHDFP